MAGRLKKAKIEGILKACEIRELAISKESGYGSPGLAILSIKNGHTLLAPFFGYLGYDNAANIVRGNQNVCFEQSFSGYLGFFQGLNQCFRGKDSSFVLSGTNELQLSKAYELLERNYLRLDNEGFIDPDSLNPPPMPKRNPYAPRRVSPVKRSNYLFLIENL